jgi:hypothetical protein
MKPRRSLTLARESLTELTPDDLAMVAGGDDVSGLTCPVVACASDLTCWLTQQPRCF